MGAVPPAPAKGAGSVLDFGQPDSETNSASCCRTVARRGSRRFARRLMATVRDSVIDTSVGAVATTISVGAVLLPEHAGSAQGAIGRALQALDIARSSRSDRFSLYQPCERRDSERRRAVGIADEIVRALNDRRMILALQPIVTSRATSPSFTNACCA